MSRPLRKEIAYTRKFDSRTHLSFACRFQSLDDGPLPAYGKGMATFFICNRIIIDVLEGKSDMVVQFGDYYTQGEHSGNVRQVI